MIPIDFIAGMVPSSAFSVGKSVRTVKKAPRRDRDAPPRRLPEGPFFRFLNWWIHRWP